MFIDTHIDTLWAMNKQNRKFSERSELGHVDLSRAQEAGLLCGFFTGFPTSNQYTTEKMLADWVKFTNDPDSKITRITSFKEFQTLRETRKSTPDINNHKIGAVLHFEGAAGIDSELNRLYIYHDLGLRSMGMTWNETNQFATGQEGDKNRGLTSEGFDLLSAMVDLGIIIDVSHLNDKSFWDVSNNTNGSIFASHSNVRKIANHNRNLEDDMIIAIADSGGSIGVNLYNAFLETDPEDATLQSVINMYAEIINLTGTKYVHSGADLDGAPFPEEIKDVTDLSIMFDQVKEKLDLSEQDETRIKIENISRLMKNVWKE